VAGKMVILAEWFGLKGGDGFGMTGATLMEI
jgi:hypothetical protein